MLHIASKEIIPAVVDYVTDICQSASLKKSLNLNMACACEEGLVSEISAKQDELFLAVNALKKALNEVPREDASVTATYYKEVIIPAMADVRKPADELELLVGRDYWPFPTYGDLLFSVV